MDDYIKRSDAVNAVYHHCISLTMIDVKTILHEAQSADVQPVRHGQFVGVSYDGYADGNPLFYECKCSECGYIFDDEELTFNYCPNCGARMDGEQND